MTTIEQEPHYLPVKSSRPNTTLISTLFLCHTLYSRTEKGGCK
jgi:hypothetical protein